jgi:hypothetical protein
MYSQRINTSWQGKNYMEVWHRQKFSHSSLNPIFSFIPLTFRAMPIATRIVTYSEVSTFINIYMPNSAVLHRFIADKVRNCQVFNPIVSILFQASVHRLLGLHCAKSVKWAEFLLTRVAI